MSEKIRIYFLLLFFSIACLIVSIVNNISFGIYSSIIGILICSTAFQTAIAVSLLCSVFNMLLVLLFSKYFYNYTGIDTCITIVIYIFAESAGLLNHLKSAQDTVYKKDLLSVVKSMMDIIDAKSPQTCKHTERVSKYCVKIGQSVHLSKKQLNQLECAALLHDLGKIAMPDSILNKPSSLSPDEYEIIKSHPQRGYEIVKNISNFKEIAPLILSHHERFDGSGYPNHLKGDKIPYLSRIIAVADSFDVILSKRPYKDCTDVDYAINELLKCKSIHFDGNIVDSFVFLLSNDSELRNMAEGSAEQ